MSKSDESGTKKRIIHRIVSFLRGTGLSLFIAIIIATSLKSAIADWNDVPTGSMEPTILVGDRIFVNKLAYDLKIPYTTYHISKWDDPERGDVVVFFSPEDGTRLVKRVIGVPGDVIGLYNNKVYINGQFLDYETLEPLETVELGDNEELSSLYYREILEEKPHLVKLQPKRRSVKSFSPMVIPAGKYFMMGDNRDNSSDSRFFGYVDRNLIVGKATKIVFSRVSFFKPRWERSFEEIL